MNGRLTAGTVAAMLERKAAHLRQRSGMEFDVYELRDMLAALAADVDKAARTDINEVAVEVVRANDNHLLNRKIQAIKEVREQTGSGLKEAKDAVEFAVCVVLRERAEEALKALAQANERVPMSNRRQVWAHAPGIEGSVDTAPF